MEEGKKFIKDIVDYSLRWVDIQIEDVERDIIKLKELGCTHIVMDYEYDRYGDVCRVQHGYIRRLETDEEYSDRINSSYIKSKIIEERELREFERLKNKYNL